VDGKTEGSHCSVCEYVIKAQETDPKTGHHYNEPVFVWGVNGKVTVTATCEKNDDTKTLTAKVDSERTSEPTCTEKGTILYTATVEFENETYTSTHEEDIPANEHEYDDLVFDWDDEGNVNVTATCIYNDDTLTYEAEVTSERTEPTCTEKGKIVYTAKVVIDDEIYTSNHEVDIPAAGHDWEAKFTWTPKAEGGYDVTAKRVCKTDPNHEESAENVIVDSKITKYPTSAEEGEKEYTATATFSDAAYTDKKTDKIEKLNQDYEFVGFEWSADNTSATVVVKDKNNGNAEVRFPADMSSEKHEPTCTEKGKTVYTATYGGNSESKTVYDESEEGKALGHSYTIVEANTDGTHTLTCDRCEEGTEEHSSIVKCSEGEPITENKVPSTCKEAGKYDEVVYCTVCKAELSRDSKTIDKLAHTPGDMVVENEVSPTCQKEGSYDEVICCTVCGEVTSRITKTIEKTSHTPGEAVVENKKAATCAAEGSYDEVVYCTVCGEEISGSRTTITLPIDKTAHVWSDWTVVTPATPTSDGTERRICSVCGETEERTIQISGEKSRQIQFVVTSGMHYVVHMEKDYTVSGKSARALYWYNDVDLNFEVVTGAGWGYDRYFVQVNGTILEPNDDGTYTLPGGTGYAQINVTPVIVTPSGGSSNTTECKYCGKLHPVTLWGRIVAFFHAIFYWIKSLFSK
ncbi:MAG: hypothetical protein J1E34_07845, partial [Oscillospiraceae bacterium]|nr:hypothetical protein [Oscillospiraceae bacterium]